MHAQSPHHCSLLHRSNRPNLLLPSEIPQLDFAVSTPGDEFTETTALHMYIRDPLIVFAPDFDHGKSGLHALVEDADGAVTVTGDDDVALDGISGE